MVKVNYKGKGEVVTLYDRNRGDDLFGTLYIKKNSRHFLGSKIILVGLVLSLLGFSLNLLPVLASEASFRLFLQKNIETNNSDNIPVVFDSFFYETETINEFKIRVPKLNMESMVGANVDPSNSEEYKSILTQKGVAHARGSYLPDQSGGPVVLFAHSTNTLENILQFNAKFFGLKELEIGDEIIINYGNKDYVYRVSNKKITSPTDLASIQEAQDDLVLSTCWPPGETWQRLLIFAKIDKRP